MDPVADQAVRYEAQVELPHNDLLVRQVNVDRLVPAVLAGKLGEGGLVVRVPAQPRDEAGDGRELGSGQHQQLQCSAAQLYGARS